MNTKLMGILTMLCSLFGCSSAQTQGFKSLTVDVNCRSGKRSKNAAGILVKNGFKVIELDAGYNDWLAKGMPVTK